MHVASSPNEAIANLTGKTRQSTDFTVTGSRQMEIGFNNSVDYAVFAEAGTRKIKARRTILRSIIRQRQQIRKLLKFNIKDKKQ